MHKRGITRCRVRVRPRTQTPLYPCRRGMRPPISLKRQMPYSNQWVWPQHAQSWQAQAWQQPKPWDCRHHPQYNWGSTYWNQSQWQNWGYRGQDAKRKRRQYQAMGARHNHRRYQPKMHKPPDAVEAPQVALHPGEPTQAPAPPATAQASAPAALQNPIITPPGPSTPPSTTECEKRMLHEYLQKEINGDVAKCARRSQTPPPRNNTQVAQGSQSPKSPKRTWRKRYKLTSLVYETPAMAQDMGGMLRPSFLPKPGVSRNHRDSQLCS